MKSYSLKLILLTAACAISVSLSAQKNDSARTIRNVQIEREYTPEVTPVERPNVDMKAEDPKVQKANPAFSDYIQLYDIKVGPMVPMTPKQFALRGKAYSKAGYLRLGAGPMFNWLADFRYPIINDDNSYLDIFANHYGILNVGSDPAKKLFNTALGLNFRTNIDANNLYVSAMYANEAFNYYGSDTTVQTDLAHRDWDKVFLANQMFHKFDFLFGLKSRDRNDSELLWDAYFNYHLHATASSVAEHNINAIAAIDLLIDDNKLTAEGGARMYLYGNRDSSLTNKLPKVYGIDNNKWKPNVVFYITPAFWWDFDNVKIKLGAKTFFSLVKSPVIALSPDVKIDYFLEKTLNIYAGVGGDYHINSLANTTAENRYYNLSGTQHNTYNPFDLYAGINLNITKGLMFNASASYKYVFNEMFFVNNAFSYGADICYNKYFDAAYLNGGLFSANMRLNYNYRERINMFASMEYNKWFFAQSKDGNSTVYAWHTPEWRVNAGTEFTIGDDFFGGFNFYFASKMKAEQFALDVAKNIKQKVLDLPAVYDLNVNAGYNVSENFSIFAQLNNILAIVPSLNPQIWYGYQTMGFNGLIGFTVQF